MKVNVPGVGAVNFPDSMSEDQVSNVIKTQILPKVGGGTSQGTQGTSQPTIAAPAPAVSLPPLNNAALFGALNEPQVPKNPMEHALMRDQIRKKYEGMMVGANPAQMPALQEAMTREQDELNQRAVAAGQQPIQRLKSPEQLHAEQVQGAMWTPEEAQALLGPRLGRMLGPVERGVTQAAGGLSDPENVQYAMLGAPRMAAALAKPLAAAMIAQSVPGAGQTLGALRKGEYGKAVETGIGTLAPAALGALAFKTPRAKTAPLPPTAAEAALLEGIKPKAAPVERKPIITPAPEEVAKPATAAEVKPAEKPPVAEVKPTAEEQQKYSQPLQVKSATRVAGKLYDIGGEHRGTESMAAQKAHKEATGQHVNLERGWVDQHGNFYQTEPQVIRAKVAHDANVKRVKAGQKPLPEPEKPTGLHIVKPIYTKDRIFYQDNLGNVHASHENFLKAKAVHDKQLTGGQKYAVPEPSTKGVPVSTPPEGGAGVRPQDAKGQEVAVPQGGQPTPEAGVRQPTPARSGEGAQVPAGPEGRRPAVQPGVQPVRGERAPVAKGAGETPPSPAAERPLPQEGVGPKGGRVSSTKRQQSNARRIVPALLEGGKTILGKQGQTHNDIIAEQKLSKDATRGFVLDGRFLTREQAAQETGLKTQYEAGKLHSTDLPGYKGPQPKPLTPPKAAVPKKAVVGHAAAEAQAEAMFGKKAGGLKIKLNKDAEEAGFVNIGAAYDAVTDAIRDMYGKVEPALNKVAEHYEAARQVAERMNLRRKGEMLAFHAQKDKRFGNAAYLLAQARASVAMLKEVDPKLVLPPGVKEGDQFDNTLGAVWTEAQLRQRRSEFLAAGDHAKANAVESLVGKGIIQDEAHYQQLLRNNDIQDASLAMRRLIGNAAEARHKGLGGKLAQAPGIGFVNLLIKEQPKTAVTTGPRGAQQKGTAFGQHRTGAGTNYDTSATRIMQNMIEGNYHRARVKNYFDEAVRSGNGYWGDERQEGYSSVPHDVTRLIIKEEGEPTKVYTKYRDFYLKSELKPEFDRITGQHDQQAQYKFADFVTKVQVAAGIDVLNHSVNMVSALNGAARESLGANIIGVREAATLGDLVKTVGQTLADDPHMLRTMHTMAEQGIVRDLGTMHGLFGERSWSHEMVKNLDRASRAIFYRAAENMAAKGLGTMDKVEIRRQIDKQMGVYNKRLMSGWWHVAKSTFSPFSVASKTFNSLATQRLMLASGFKAANKAAWTKLAARQLAYAATAYFVAPMMVNMAQTGQPFPEGVKLGELVVGKNDDGTYKTFDALKLNFMRRALRVTGLGQVASGQVLPRLRGEKPAPLAQTARKASLDIIRGAAAPYVTGPLPQAGAALMFGKTALGYPATVRGETEAPYFGAAARQLNPVAGALSEGSTTGEGVEPLRKRLEQIAGFGTSSKPAQIVGQLRRQFAYGIGKRSQGEFVPSEYTPLISALEKDDKDAMKKEYGRLMEYLVSQHQEAAEVGKTPEGEARKQLQDYFEKYAKGHGKLSKENEEAFVKTLTPHQKDLYDGVMKDNQQLAAKFFSELQGEEKKPKGGYRFGKLRL